MSFSRPTVLQPLTGARLYTFIDSAYLGGRDPVDLARQLCLGGSDLIQLRAKDWSPNKIAEVAGQILPVTRKYSVRLVINDYPEIAQRLNADLCHLGQEDFFDSGHLHVSELAGGGLRPEIGMSTHSPEQAIRALSANAAYIAIGPVFATGTKPMAHPVTLEYVRWARENVRIPWFAIGGITLENLDQVIAAGASRICVVSAILNSRDVTAACQAFRLAIDRTCS